MREIKFRAWLKEDIGFQCGKKNFMSNDFSIEEHISVNDYLHTMQYNGHVLMQYIGLKDKNGVDIYEGDILKVYKEEEYITNRDSGGRIIDYYTKEGFLQIGIVIASGCSFCYETWKTLRGKEEIIYCPIDWLENYEVVGNVYENEELLEV